MTQLTVKKKQELSEKLEKVISENSITDMVEMTPTAQALALSAGIQEIAKALDPLMKEFMPLAGSRLGFKMDEDEYPLPVVRGAMVQALLRGVPLVGNHFNVIAKDCYITLEGFTYLVQNYPGLTDLVVKVREPDQIKKVDKNAAATMPVDVSWRIDGTPQQYENAYRVVMYAGNASYYDGLVGKAKRRALKDVYSTLVGGVLAPPDADDLPESEAKDVTPPEETVDETVKASNEIGANLLDQIEACADQAALLEISEIIKGHKDADDLTPSALKKLGSAYTAKVKELEGAES